LKKRLSHTEPDFFRNLLPAKKVCLRRGPQLLIHTVKLLPRKWKWSVLEALGELVVITSRAKALTQKRKGDEKKSDKSASTGNLSNANSLETKESKKCERDKSAGLPMEDGAGILGMIAEDTEIEAVAGIAVAAPPAALLVPDILTLTPMTADEMVKGVTAARARAVMSIPSARPVNVAVTGGDGLIPPLLDPGLGHPAVGDALQ
jgi:hypothetical protein